VVFVSVEEVSGGKGLSSKRRRGDERVRGLYLGRGNGWRKCVVRVDWEGRERIGGPEKEVV